MKIKTCHNHISYIYTLKAICQECNKPTHDAHYKFLGLRDAPKTESLNQKNDAPPHLKR
ncbi:MAG: hypothetical protein AABY00_02345 [Nanoarchaeota archaeon]